LKRHLTHITKLFFLFNLLTGLTTYAQGSWEKIDLPTLNNLNTVFFTDSLYGWVAGDSGTILHTTDGGINWNFQESEISEDLINIFFLNRNLGWATAFKFSTQPYGTLLLKTTDGGKNWSNSNYPENNIFMNCVLFLDSLNGWMGGSPHALVSTQNGGQTWESATVDSSTLAFFPVLNIKFYDENYGYACGGRFDIAGVTWRTSDGGETWYAIPVNQAPADEVHQLHLFDSITVMGAGGDPDFGYGVGMLNTIDGGYNWFYNELTIQGNAYDLAFRNETDAWASLGQRKKMIYSLDAGLSWNVIPTPDSTAIYKLHFPDSLHGFAVGREGALIKFIPSVQVGIKTINETDKKFVLHQNNPNPFNGKTSIRFELKGDDSLGSISSYHIRLKIFNSFGEYVDVLLDEEFLPGKLQTVFDASGLPGGFYYYQLEVSSKGGKPLFRSVKKMVVTD